MSIHIGRCGDGFRRVPAQHSPAPSPCRLQHLLEGAGHRNHPASHGSKLSSLAMVDVCSIVRGVIAAALVMIPTA
ncbi:hypothetical protein PILCRDRAFT_810343 [Piloderma croceum F 1598]|uniref:Uncharacterized protein n=1 Tax=Piloderma croceum (strain F 1598) TaxID=765440 RepID=A0A0C3G7T4_PILCF|nr:hypothetical protein PILCRDRAFT_810343 [Piloderma croceum F 1598]